MLTGPSAEQRFERRGGGVITPRSKCCGRFLKVTLKTVLTLFDVVRFFTYTRAKTVLKELGKLSL